MKTIENRTDRILARGEVSGHSHIITGECEISRNGEDVIIKAGENCAIKHLLEQPFINEGVEVWTKEHADIPLTPGQSYKYVQQIEFNPYEKATRKVQD
jgi:uncharacterized protein involved in tellurium resistance